MKLVHVASEMFPYVKTGGLADAVGALAHALADRGHTMAVFLPGYRSVIDRREFAKAERVLRLNIEMGDEFVSGDVYRLQPRKALSVYLVVREEFYDRKFPYGTPERDYDDNAERFIFFCQAVIDTLRLTDFKADVVHCHDWQTALLPLLLRLEERTHGLTIAMKTVFTIHNIAFQGIFPMKKFALTNLPEELRGVDGLEYYGQMNCMKGGILFADRVTTVSPTYAREIQTPEFGCGLDGVVSTRAADLAGLINGIDDEVWNPSRDALLPATYSADDLSGKAECRAKLLKTFNWSEKFKGPIFGMVCRFAEQKGIDLVLAAREFFAQENVKLVILGSGSKSYEEALRRMAEEHPGKIAVAVRLDEEMSHLIEAGADFFLMPSIFEPCGLNQMYSQRYGTIPLASRVGGLADTVIDADADPENGTGLSFPPHAAEFRAALHRALALFEEKPRYAAVQRRGMAKDFSWKRAARAYEQLYHDSI